jgi:hypothetical protein
MDTNYTETPTQGRVCHICHHPPWTTLTLEESTNCISGSRYNDLQVSSVSCPGCMLFVKVFGFATTHPDLRKGYQLWFHVTNGEFMISVVSYHSQIRLEAFVLPSAISLPNLRTASIIPPRTNLDLNITNIKRWLYGCQNTHAQCGEESDYLPMRLLELGADERFTKLVETASLPERTLNTSENMNYQYACLSHCWGNSRSKHLNQAREPICQHVQHPRC